MRILFVTPYVPSRIRVRPFQLIKALSTQHDIILVSLLCDEYERRLVQDVASYCASIHLIPLSKKSAYLNCLYALPTCLPLRVAYYQSPEFVKRILNIIYTHDIDIVHGELIKVTPALAVVQKHVPILYDAVDCTSSYLQQQWLATHNVVKKAFVYSELKKMRQYEGRVLRKFDQVIITSPHDRNCLVDMSVPQEHIHVVPNGVDTEYFTPLAAPRTADTLVFCAKMDYYPNSQAMLRFCDQVLPRIWQHRPQVRLTIVGNNPPQAIRDLSIDTRIIVTGYVPDIRPYLGKAAVALAPLLVAAGMQNKVLEALAMETPIVTTAAACRSLHVKHGVHLLIADSVHACADAVLELLDKPQLAHNLGLAGRQYVEQHHSWVNAAHMLSDLYSALGTKKKQQTQVLDYVRL